MHCINVIFFFFKSGNGQNDFVMCFFCSQGLRDWDEKDDPWEEHSRWSPKCSFLLLSKGKEFVMEACKNMIKRDPVKQARIIYLILR